MTESYEYAATPPRVMELWGHLSGLLLKVSIAASIVLGLQTSYPTLLSLLVRLALLAFVVVTWLMMRRHDRRLCESCAAAIPLNAAEQSQRYRRRFFTAHAGTNPKLVIPYLVVLIGSNVLLTLPHGRWGWAVVQASMIYLISAHTTHRRLQPWCPWCSGGGGGTEHSVGEPDAPRGPGRQLV
ncbi:hypothetical protein BH10ACT8_BH10ACT8_22080 [soil metagenome]|jgi:hypothetical protein